MSPDEIRMALETAVGVPEGALLAAVAQPSSVAPELIAVAQSMADGCMPLPPQERLLRFGLYAMSVAREPSVCPGFLSLLRRPLIEVEWLFSEDDRINRIARTTLGLFDGNDAALSAIAANPSVDGHTRAGLLLALARLVWEGRASRDGLLDLLDRFDQEELAESGSWAWFGWQEAILLLGLTDWIDRVRAAWDAGRDIPTYERQGEDRDEWIKLTHRAAERPEDEQRFIDEQLRPFDDPTGDLGWSADADGKPDDPLTIDEFAWLSTALWRHTGASVKPLEWADGSLTALAVAPEPPVLAECLPAIIGDGAAFETPAHAHYAEGLLRRHFAAIANDLALNEPVEPFIEYEFEGAEGALWAEGYFAVVAACKDTWAPLMARQSLVESLIFPIMSLLPDPDAPAELRLTTTERWPLIRELPDIIAKTWAFWRDDEHPLLTVQPERRVKVGRNDPCPCGSGKKYKRCCGAVV